MSGDLARARDELTSVADERLKYAALELCMALESLTYYRAVTYRDECPPSGYETWQPRKMMAIASVVAGAVPSAPVAPGYPAAPRYPMAPGYPPPY
ncbi:hypothetical protein GLUCORHAEAF1_12320 [Komagataeibacter rhaeticus AF1]|uniref:hypothetical protein n=1 Tax=Komagataeibacter rhaeticus TaxID=215221 RepID=UPI0004D5C806|nr:hypothetical protein [Komagataeibacter rhaeticus]KDU94704.1 hypothetical protein GLUCORHAEAF1_12320 [Komagataeibacter rhaeticus AF1]